MNTLKFKTSINCSSCVAKVTPVLNAQEDIQNWEVNTENPDKILTVEGQNIDEEHVIKSLQKIGFKAEKI
ncbi:heavy-metal-associated domain-containing protein [Pedobacter nanyangensis]|uniref:heavy-metal-associated domain-containing protein n=1 Tax=Pedobacter nanyangensis TaxID=1562389 RepID=UPI000DE36B30|nr:heavy-metal-associated domain-containing protein [Pedobacter nanyangensis]